MHLHGVLTHLAMDACAEVRICVASGLLEVMRILGRDRSTTYLKDCFLQVLPSKNTLGVFIYYDSTNS